MNDISTKDQHRKQRCKRKRKEEKICQQLPLPAPESAAFPAPSLHSLGWKHPNFSSRQEVHHRLITLIPRKQLRDLHMSSSSHFQPVAFPPTFHIVFCWSLHRLQWRKRCFCVWAAIQPPLLHHHHLLSSRWPNHFSLTPVGACPDFCLKNLVSSDFVLVIGMDLLAPALPLSL